MRREEGVVHILLLAGAGEGKSSWSSAALRAMPSQLVARSSAFISGKLLEAIGSEWAMERMRLTNIACIASRVEESLAKANVPRLSSHKARLKNAEAAGKEAEAEKAHAEAAAARIKVQIEVWEQMMTALSQIVQGGGAVAWGEAGFRSWLAFAENAEPEVREKILDHIAQLRVLAGDRPGDAATMTKRPEDSEGIE